MYDPRKPSLYHFIVQWDAVPDYVLTTVGRTPPDNVRTYEHLERFKTGGNRLQEFARRLVWYPEYVEKWTANNSFIQRILASRTGFTKIPLDRAFNNVIVFEGTYSSKAYLQQWKKQNDLTFVLFITDVNQFSDHGRFNIATSHYDYVVSQYTPPPDFASLVHLTLEETNCTPLHDPDWIQGEYRARFAKQNADVPDELDVFLSGTSTPIRDKLMLPLCNAIRGAGLRSFFSYSGLSTPLDDFPFLRAGFPDTTRFLHPIESHYFSQHSNCLIEITKSEPPHVVERFHRAVMYNKKYLGNNPGIRSSPYYNEDWMKVISSPEDITPELIEWIQAPTDIDYGYDGRWEFGNTVIRPIEELLQKSAKPKQ